jgi:DNA-directed RNA polymerase specialized sigma24 family protein
MLTTRSPSTIIDDMTAPKTLPDPADTANALTAVVALRRMADDLEQRSVALALKNGWSWSQIAEVLGVSKQAAHRRLSFLQPKGGRHG